MIQFNKASQTGRFSLRITPTSERMEDEIDSLLEPFFWEQVNPRLLIQLRKPTKTDNFSKLFHGLFHGQELAV